MSQRKLPKPPKAKKVPKWIRDEKKGDDLIKWMVEQKRRKGERIEIPDDEDEYDWLIDLINQLFDEYAPLYAEKLLKILIKKNKDKP